MSHFPPQTMLVTSKRHENIFERYVFFQMKPELCFRPLGGGKVRHKAVDRDIKRKKKVSLLSNFR